MLAKAKQLVREARFVDATATAQKALGICKTAPAALEALKDAQSKSGIFSVLESAAKVLCSNGDDFEATKAKIEEALAVCPEAQSMLTMLKQIHESYRAFKAVMETHGIGGLAVGSKACVLLKAYTPPTVFFAQVCEPLTLTVNPNH